MRILVAEDDSTSRIALVAVLKRIGHEVTSVSNGEDALAALQAADAPRLAILDWMMPGLTGVQVCQRVRSESSTGTKYLILLTSRSDKEDVIEGLDAGANDYVTKPFDEGELIIRGHKPLVRSAEEGVNYMRRERRFGSFCRRVELPERVRAAETATIDSTSGSFSRSWLRTVTMTWTSLR